MNMYAHDMDNWTRALDMCRSDDDDDDDKQTTTTTWMMMIRVAYRNSLLKYLLRTEKLNWKGETEPHREKNME